jgi:hypothetical protein
MPQDKTKFLDGELPMSNHTVEKFDPKTHDPVKDPPPHGTGIPRVVENKLDVIAVQLATSTRE